MLRTGPLGMSLIRGRSAVAGPDNNVGTLRTEGPPQLDVIASAVMTVIVDNDLIARRKTAFH